MNPEKGVAEAVEVARRIGRKLLIAAKCNEEAEEKYFDEHVRPRLGDDAVFLGDVDGAEKRELFGASVGVDIPYPVGRAVRPGDDRGHGMWDAGSWPSGEDRCRRSSTRE